MPPAMPLVTAVALLAVLVARAGLARPARRLASAARLRALYGLLAALLVLRLLVVAWPHPLVASALMLVSAWLPVATLRLAEELRRRHAPRVAKLAALTGALGFSVVAVSVGLVWSEAAAGALAGWQAIMLLVVLVLLASSRGDVALAERLTIDAVTIALVAAVPLVLSDFAVLWADAPLRGGAFAALLLVLATSLHSGEGGRPYDLARDVLVSLGVGGLILIAGRGIGVADDGAIALAGCGAAVGALVLILERAYAQRSQGTGLIPALARVDTLDRTVMLAAHPVLASGRLLEGRELASYPARSIDLLADHRIISAETGDRECRDAASDLLLATSATHLLRLGREPLEFLAVVCDGLVPQGRDDELAVAARLLEAAR